jgi:hypothetical protein
MIQNCSPSIYAVLMGLFPLFLRGKTCAAGRSYITTVSLTAFYFFRNKKKLLKPLHTIAILINFISDYLFSSSKSEETIFLAKHLWKLAPLKLRHHAKSFWRKFQLVYGQLKQPSPLLVSKSLASLTKG